MDGWMNGWMGGYVGGWMDDGWVDAYVGGWISERMSEPPERGNPILWKDVSRQ